MSSMQGKYSFSVNTANVNINKLLKKEVKLKTTPEEAK